MMRFNVPFILDEQYIDDLKRLEGRLYAVHFSLHQPVLADARVRLHAQGLQPIINGLQQIPGVKKYLLANARFQSAENYRAGGALSRLIACLEQLMAGGVLHGIIFSDGYFLRALSDAAPHLATRLEAIPSINFMIDSAERLEAVMAILNGSRFLPPDKIPLDRALNRRPESLRDLAAVIRERYPEMRVELLANEGCLNHCAFRGTHEALIAAANVGAPIDTFRLNRDLGCVRILSETPHCVLSSPFIRPEDLSRYADAADIIKICGRTLGSRFLRRAVSAYAAERYEGNLLDLLDAANWMTQHWDLPNSKLPEGLMERLTTCDQNCSACKVCRELFQQHARALAVHLQTFERT